MVPCNIIHPHPTSGSRSSRTRAGVDSRGFCGVESGRMVRGGMSSRAGARVVAVGGCFVLGSGKDGWIRVRGLGGKAWAVPCLPPRETSGCTQGRPRREEDWISPLLEGGRREKRGLRPRRRNWYRGAVGRWSRSSANFIMRCTTAGDARAAPMRLRNECRELRGVEGTLCCRCRLPYNCTCPSRKSGQARAPSLKGMACVPPPESKRNPHRIHRCMVHIS
ncbi:hypothetical protein B0H11DRAFT_2052556, partial [Mycena galericulata]